VSKTPKPLQQQTLTENDKDSLARILPKIEPDLALNLADLSSGGRDAASVNLGLVSDKDVVNQAPRFDADLSLVVKHWPGLPEHIRAAIKALVKTSGVAAVKQDR